MIKIKILGGGCPKCDKTEENLRQALVELGLEAEVIKVKDLTEIMKYNVMLTPALVVNNEVKITGNVPSVSKIKDLLKDME